MSEEEKRRRTDTPEAESVPQEEDLAWQERVLKDCLLERLLASADVEEEAPLPTENLPGPETAPRTEEPCGEAMFLAEVPPQPQEAPQLEEALEDELPPLEEKPQKGQELYEWTQALVCAVLAVVLLFTFVVRLIGVDGHSMVPTLQDGDRLLVVTSFLQRDYQAGDIVVVRKASFMQEPIVKRIVATGGQTVDIDFQYGGVYVDGQLLDEPYINELTYLEEGTEFPITVPEGSFFLMGDNRNRSNDSRDSTLGTVDQGYVIGKAALVLFPGKDEVTGKRDFGRMGLLQH